eukprot:GEMP01036317.1.p1 GENE.GEMP01036317.1~~GEMP01036317.1.p1  ORF type:complete len:253 (+),score=27.12 GEMP01036317.1:185-943(+)
MPQPTDERGILHRIGSYLLDSVVFWLILLLVCLGASAVCAYYFYVEVDEGKGQITNLTDPNIRPIVTETTVVALIGGAVIYVVGGGSAILVKKFIVQLMRPKAPRNLPSLSQLEIQSATSVGAADAFPGVRPDQARNQLAAGELYLKMKVKVVADERLNILREGVGKLEAIPKADANNILGLFSDEKQAVEAFDLMEPYMISEEAEFRRKLSRAPTASGASASSIEHTGGARQSLWFSRIKPSQPIGAETAI